MRAVIYARLDSYNTSESYVAAQLQVCQEFANKRGYSVLGTYIDRCVGTERAGFDKLITDAELRLFDAVIVFKLDRFSAFRDESMRRKDDLRRQNVQVLSATEFIPDTAEGAFIETVLSGMAEYSERVQRTDGTAESESGCITEVMQTISEVVPAIKPISNAVGTVKTIRQELLQQQPPQQQLLQQQPPQQQLLQQQPPRQSPPQQLPPAHQFSAQSQQTPQTSLQRRLANPLPNKDMENFFGKHIAAILAGVLIIVATIASISVAWGVVTPLVRFGLLFIFGSAMMTTALIKHKRLPELFTYPVIRNLFAASGMVVLFIDILLGYMLLQLYSLIAACVLLILWSMGSLYVAYKFKLITAQVVGVLGVLTGCWFAAFLTGDNLALLCAAGFGCVYFIVVFYQHKRFYGRVTAMYIFTATAAFVTLLAVLPALFAERFILSSAIEDIPLVNTVGESCALAVLMIVVQAAFLLVDSKKSQVMPILGNIIFTAATLVNAVIVSTLLDNAASNAFSGCILLVTVIFALKCVEFLPSCLILLFCSASMPSNSFVSSIGVLLTLLCVITVVSYRSYAISIKMRRCISLMCTCTVSLLLLGMTSTGFNVVAGVILLALAYIMVTKFINFCVEFPYGQVAHLSTAGIAVMAASFCTPDIDGVREPVFVILSSVLMLVYLVVFYDKRIDCAFYRRFLLSLCSFVAGVQSVTTLDAPAWLAFAGVIMFMGAIFYRFVYKAWSTKTSVYALWLIACQVYLWLNFLVPEGMGVLPSVVLIGLGFTIIRFGFSQKRNALRISGLVMVILCTIKAVSIDVWFAHSLIRVLVLLVGAGICIAVSRLYAKQSLLLRAESENEKINNFS